MKCIIGPSRNLNTSVMNLKFWNPCFHNLVFPKLAILLSSLIDVKVDTYLIKEKLTIVDPNGEPLFYIALDSILQYFKISVPSSLHVFSTKSLMEIYLLNSTLPLSHVTENVHTIISMIFFSIRYKNDEWVDEVILGFFSVFSPGKKPFVLFKFN